MNKLFSSLKFIVNCKYKLHTKKKYLINLIKSYIPNTLISWLLFVFNILKFCLHILVYLFSFSVILTYESTPLGGIIIWINKFINLFNFYYIYKL